MYRMRRAMFQEYALTKTGTIDRRLNYSALAVMGSCGIMMYPHRLVLCSCAPGAEAK